MYLNGIKYIFLPFSENAKIILFQVSWECLPSRAGRNARSLHALHDL